MENKPSTLYAFYDFALSTPKYDFLNFLMIAELYRKRHNYQHIYIILVPGHVNGFRGGPNPPQDYDILAGMLRNIVIPGCWLLPACSGVSSLSSRDDADLLVKKHTGNVFPRGYTVEAPVSDFMWSSIVSALICGETLTQFRAPKEYSNLALEYCRSIAGDRKLLTITMRESSYHTSRNSKISEWLKFINYLDENEYAVVIVRDTEKAHAPPLTADIPECPLASIDIGFRAALHEHSYLSLHSVNGAGCVPLFGLQPYISFGFNGQDENHFASTPAFFKQHLGMEHGDQLYGFPSSQKVVWEKESFDIICSAFESHIQHLMNNQDDVFSLHDFSSRTQIFDTANMVQENVAERIAYGVMSEDETVLLKVKELTNGELDSTYNLLGVVLYNLGKVTESEEALKIAIDRQPENRIAHLNLIRVLEHQNKKDEAQKIHQYVENTLEQTPSQ